MIEVTFINVTQKLKELGCLGDFTLTFHFFCPSTKREMIVDLGNLQDFDSLAGGQISNLPTCLIFEKLFELQAYPKFDQQRLLATIDGPISEELQQQIDARFAERSTREVFHHFKAGFLTCGLYQAMLLALTISSSTLQIHELPVTVLRYEQIVEAKGREKKVGYAAGTATAVIGAVLNTRRSDERSPIDLTPLVNPYSLSGILFDSTTEARTLGALQIAEIISSEYGTYISRAITADVMTKLLENNKSSGGTSAQKYTHIFSIQHQIRSHI